jgi:hypothetical protein
VIGVTRGQAQETLLYEEPWFLGLTLAQGPLGLATDEGGLYIASVSTGDLIHVQH